jgi:hypothetical protein
MQQSCAVAGIGTDGSPLVQQRAKFAVHPGPCGQLVEFRVGTTSEVLLDTSVSEQGGRETKRLVRDPLGRVGPLGSDMGPDQFRRQQLTSPLLDGLTLNRIDAVGRPDPVCPLQDREIDPAAAAGAAFNLQGGMACPQCVKQPVQGQGLGVHSWQVPPIVAASHCLVQVTVMVPFQVVDGIPRDQGVDGFQQVRPGILVGQVENILVPGCRAQAT